MIKQQLKYKNLTDTRIKEATNKILDMFKHGDVSKTISLLTFPKFDIPCNSWSLRNRLIAYLHGTGDARGFMMWKETERKVKKGRKAFYILAPNLIKVDQKINRLYFPIIVLDGKLFGITNEEGKPNVREEKFIPLIIETGDDYLDRIIIYIVRKDYLETFIDKLGEDLKSFNGNIVSFLSHPPH